MVNAGHLFRSALQHPRQRLAAVALAVAVRAVVDAIDVDARGDHPVVDVLDGVRAHPPEGNAAHDVAVKVKLNNPTGQAVSVHYATADGSATSNIWPGRGSVSL